MCRNIRLLHNFEPPTTDEEIQNAALQFVRKVSGINKPSNADAIIFEAAVLAIAGSTKHLLKSLSARGNVHTRDGEQAKARARWEKRAAR